MTSHITPHNTAITRPLFALPQDVTYLDGNSLGPLPHAAKSRVADRIQDEWGAMLITAWNRAGWMDEPARISARIARLIGAEPDHVTLGDTLSLRLYQALHAALSLAPQDRREVITDSGNFPSDLYMAQGLLDTLNAGHTLRVVAPEQVETAISDQTAVLMLTQVDYRTGAKHDMSALTAKAHKAGALTVWDLAHSAGAIPVDLTAAQADFAVGCTYKFLNGGPGAPAFLYAAPRHADRVQPALRGWLGHAQPFDFTPDYRPAAGINRFRVGTPPVLAMAALDAALDAFDDTDMAALHSTAITLSERLINGVANHAPQLRLASPADPMRRGAQVSFRHPDAYAICQALIANGVIGDFRAPDILRFGITPLYTTCDDMDRAVQTLADVMKTRAWDRPEYHARNAVT